MNVQYEHSKAEALAAAAAMDSRDEEEDERDEATFSDVMTQALVESERTYQAQIDCAVKVQKQLYIYLVR